METKDFPKQDTNRVINRHEKGRICDFDYFLGESDLFMRTRR